MHRLRDGVVARFSQYYQAQKEQFPEYLGLKYHAVFALADYGLGQQARELFDLWQLSDISAPDRAALAGPLAYYRATLRDGQPATRPGDRFGDADLTRFEEPLPPGTVPLARSRLSATVDAFATAFEDVSTLEARLIRDLAWQDTGVRRRQLARQAADAYCRVYEETGRERSGMAAAACFFLAGDPNTAAAMAHRVLAEVAERAAAAGGAAKPPDVDDAVVRALGCLMTHPGENLQDAQRIIEESLQAVDAVRAKTFSRLAERALDSGQIRQVLAELSARVQPPVNNPEEFPPFGRFLQTFKAPTVAYYCGHMISVKGAPSRFLPDDIERVNAEINRHLTEWQVGAGYGSLACGADILFAEALLKRKLELHVILPFDDREFVETSVRRAGDEWIARFERCRAAATSVTRACGQDYLGDTSLFQLGNEVAMGMASMRAEALRLQKVLLSVWDGIPAPPRQTTGTGAIVRKWESLDLGPHCHIKVSNPAQASRSYSPRPGQGTGRELRSLVFGDIESFSALREPLLPKFWDVVIKGFSHVVEQFKRKPRRNEPEAKPDDNGHYRKVLHYSTWGDALHAVLERAEDAAELSLMLQEWMAEANFAAHGLPSDLALRIGAHYGPVYKRTDGNTSEENWYGSEVSRAARIEPVADAGQICVSEPLAAVIALENAREYRCVYMGVRQAAKGYGEFRMYRLKRLLNGETPPKEEMGAERQSESQARPGVS